MSATDRAMRSGEACGGVDPAQPQRRVRQRARAETRAANAHKPLADAGERVAEEHRARGRVPHAGQRWRERRVEQDESRHQLGMCRLAKIETMPPIEFPTRTAGSPTTSRRNAASRVTLADTVLSRSPPRVSPNPARSSAYTRPCRRSCGPSSTQFRCEPPSPCTRTSGVCGPSPCGRRSRRSAPDRRARRGGPARRVWHHPPSAPSSETAGPRAGHAPAIGRRRLRCAATTRQRLPAGDSRQGGCGPGTRSGTYGPMPPAHSRAGWASRQEAS